MNSLENFGDFRNKFSAQPIITLQYSFLYPVSKGTRSQWIIHTYSGILFFPLLYLYKPGPSWYQVPMQLQFIYHQ